jgi:hypothetical protein
MASARKGLWPSLMMVNLSPVSFPDPPPPPCARGAYDSTRPDADTRLSWQRKIGGLPPPAVPPGQPRNAKGVRVDTAVDGVMLAQDPTATLGDCWFGLGMSSGGASIGKVSDDLGPIMLVEDSEVVLPRESAQPGLSRVTTPSLRCGLEMSNDQGHSSNAAERGTCCIQCGPVCVDPTHDMDTLTPLDGLSQNELDGAPNFERPHALYSTGKRGSSQRVLVCTPDSLVHTSWLVRL